MAGIAPLPDRLSDHNTELNGLVSPAAHDDPEAQATSPSLLAGNSTTPGPFAPGPAFMLDISVPILKLPAMPGVGIGMLPVPLTGYAPSMVGWARVPPFPSGDAMQIPVPSEQPRPQVPSASVKVPQLPIDSWSTFQETSERPPRSASPELPTPAGSVESDLGLPPTHEPAGPPQAEPTPAEPPEPAPARPPLTPTLEPETAPAGEPPIHQAISVTEALELLESGANVFIIDDRATNDYAAGHIPGAAHIQPHELPDRLSEIPTDADAILVYCNCPKGQSAARVAKALVEAGFRNVKYLETSFEDTWTGPME